MKTFLRNDKSIISKTFLLNDTLHFMKTNSLCLVWKRAATGLDAAAQSLRLGFRAPHSFAWTLELEPWISLWRNIGQTNEN
jgi:hypothetical protein